MNLRGFAYVGAASVLLTVSFAGSGKAQLDTPAKSHNALPADARLEQPVTMDEAGITMPDALGRLSRGVTLVCDSECRDQKLQVCVVKRPLRQVMTALADMLPGTWQLDKQGSGYKLMMSAQAVKRRRDWWRLYQDMRERTLREAAANLVSAMQTPPTANILKNDENNRENHPAGVPTWTQTRLFFNALPADLQEKAAHSVNEAWLFSQEGRGSAEDQESATIVSFRSLPAGAQAVINAVKPNIPDNAWVRFTGDGINVDANFIDPKGRFVAGTSVLYPDKGSVEQSALPLDHAALIEFARMADEHPEFKMPPVLATFLSYQKSRVWKNDPPTQPLPPASAPPRRADLLYQLHKQANMEYVADYYSVKAQPAPANWLADTAQDGKAMPTPDAALQEHLNLLAAQTDSSWKRSGDLYLFRDNRWYRDDLIEVPAALAAKWLDARRKMVTPQELPPFAPPPASGSTGNFSLGQGSVPAGQTLPQSLEWKTEFAANLTRWQLANGLKWLVDEPYARSLQDPQAKSAASLEMSRYFPFAQEADGAQSGYNLLRFYALLRPEQRTALLAGKLSCATLDAPQRSLAVVVAPMLLPALSAAPASDITIRVGPSGNFNGKLTLLYDFPDKQ